MRFDSQLLRMSCQMFSTGFSLGHLARIMMVLTLPGTSSLPPGLIHRHDRVSAQRDGERDLGKMQGHRLGVAEGQNETDTLAVLQADRAKDVDRLRLLVLGRQRPGSTPRTAPDDLVLLAHTGLALEPYLYGRAFQEGSPDLCQLGNEALFLRASMACSFWAWWRSRAVSFA